MGERNDGGTLTEAVFYILLSVYHAPLHGYGIIQNIARMSNGRLHLGPGTMYGAINNMLEKGWIQGLAGESGSRKKEYIITDLGRYIAGQELNRLTELWVNGYQTIANEETRVIEGGKRDAD